MNPIYAKQNTDRIKAGTISLPRTLIIDLARRPSVQSESGVQVHLPSDYPFRSRCGGGSKDPSADDWEMAARRLLAGLSPKASPWGKGYTWEMNGFWHSSPWGKGDTWKLNDFWRSSPWGKGDTWKINKVIKKGGFWSPRASAV